MGYFLRSRVLNPSHRSSQPPIPVSPVFSPVNLDLLDLVHDALASNFDEPATILQEDLSIGFESDSDLTELEEEDSDLTELEDEEEEKKEEDSSASLEAGDALQPGVTPDSASGPSVLLNPSSDAPSNGQSTALLPAPISSKAFSSDGSQAPESSHPTCSHDTKRRRKRQQGRAKAKHAKLDQDPDLFSGPNLFRSVASPIQLNTDAAGLSAAKGAHTGKPGTTAELGDMDERMREQDVPELVSKGFRHVVCQDSIHPTPIVDIKGRIVGVFAGKPEDPKFDAAALEAFDSMMREAEAVGIGEAAESSHKRGAFPAYNRGITMGMGNDTRVYAEYKKTNEAMYAAMSSLPKPNFDGVVFNAAAFNFGGKVRTYKHRDFLNWAFGLCAITALGRFDPKKSARLILWEWKLVIDFPPGSTLLIPSALVTHSNTPIAPGDQRCSFTQYSAGAIFRWVDNGCMTEDMLRKKFPKKWKKVQVGKSDAYLQRVENFSKLDELLTQSLD